MKFKNAKLLAVIILFLVLISCSQETNDENISTDDMIIRISEIEIEPKYREEYISILKEESEASVRLEPGVISIYPMFEKEHPTEIRILEIYKNKEAYEKHLQTLILNITKLLLLKW